MRDGEPLEVVVARGRAQRGQKPYLTDKDPKRWLTHKESHAITAEQLQRARNEAAAAERRRVGEVLASLTAAGAIDGNQAQALVQLLTHPTTVADNAVARYEKHIGKNAAGTGAAIASLYEQTMGR